MFGFHRDSRTVPDSGGLTVQGSKNAVLPMMAASVLNRGITVLENVPRIQDVFCMMGILDSLGCRCALHGNRLEIDTSKMNGWRIEQKAMGKMRSSIMLLGALLGRFCEAGSTARRMYDRKTSNRLAFAATPCAGCGNTGIGAGRLPACTDNGDFAGQRLFFRFRVSARWKMPCLPLWQRWGGRFCGDARGNRRLDSCAIS